MKESVPAGEPKTDLEAGWLIEKGLAALGVANKIPSWVAFTDPGAIRFAREEDAIRMLEGIRSFSTNGAPAFAECTVSEHAWVAPPIAQPEEAQPNLPPVTREPQYYIITTAHQAIWPGGVLLFWAANHSGYSTFLEKAGRYSEDEARKICKPRDKGIGLQEFMVKCEVVEASAVRVVDLDLFQKLTASPAPEVVPSTPRGVELPLMLSDEELVQIAVEVFPDDPGFLHTEWKDGIDIQVPTIKYCELSLRLTKSLREQLATAQEEIARLKTAAQFEDKMDGQTIDERDRSEDCVAEVAAILGCEEEWSNLHDHHLCAIELATSLQQELRDAQTKIRKLTVVYDFTVAQKANIALMTGTYQELKMALQSQIDICNTLRGRAELAEKSLVDAQAKIALLTPNQQPKES